MTPIRYLRICIFIAAYLAATAFVVERHSVGRPPSRSRHRAHGFNTTTARRRRGNPLSTCHLFFRPTNVEKAYSSWRVPINTLNELTSTDLPWRVELERKNSINLGAAPILTIRTIQHQDIEAIAEMCVNEYGSGPTSNNRIGDWIDRLDREGLRILVDLTSRLKVAQPPRDHAIIIGSIDDKIVGMVEVSLQPVVPERNPPPYPIPLVLKQAFSAVTRNTLQGWITNLLIAPEYRGQGYAKALVVACESVAASWHCTSVHLHCDADETAGLVAQKLYTGMGYQPLMMPCDNRFSWMNNAAASSVVVVQGVPLLYLRKDLPKKEPSVMLQ